MNSPAGTGAATASTVTELAPPDHTYLHLDTKSRPMHWAMVLELDTGGPHLTVEEVRARVRERGALFDIFRSGVRDGRWRKPQVVLADSVDVDRHVAYAEYADPADLRQRLAALHETHLPRSAPFWDITLFTPRGSGAQFVVLRVHHSLSDGIAGAAFAALLADGTADELAEFERFATSPRYRISEIEPAMRKEAKTAFDEQWKAGRNGRGWPELTGTGRREVALHSVPTRTLRRIAKHNGATVHEFLLAAVGRTVSLAPPNTGKPQAETIRVTLPVTHDAAFRHTGNAVLVSLLNLPGNEADLTRQIERCRSELALVEARRPELALAATDDLPKLPWPLARAFANASMARMSPDIHIGINPGFSRIRSVLGKKITELTPISPLVGYSFSVTVLILGNKTSFGIVTDPAALPGSYAETFVAQFDRVLNEAAKPEDSSLRVTALQEEK
ncbi:wax ester/triacylglycerol synthase domain-containing protein [Nocardia sp. NBC_01329]|uniref:wax ester/triacylglycerol synthase domain-containing protein n=1 Tax=Nocardia sp. NBC_01329 TaxID=2903594 RepID=UPI002E14061D|nr:wax ester/triacylglycerol synthase family O-acyltransferase [Nocardia sp. NBC_01329]